MTNLLKKLKLWYHRRRIARLYAFVYAYFDMHHEAVRCVAILRSEECSSFKDERYRELYDKWNSYAVAAKRCLPSSTRVMRKYGVK